MENPFNILGVTNEQEWEYKDLSSTSYQKTIQSSSNLTYNPQYSINYAPNIVLNSSNTGISTKKEDSLSSNTSTDLKPTQSPSVMQTPQLVDTETHKTSSLLSNPLAIGGVVALAFIFPQILKNFKK